MYHSTLIKLRQLTTSPLGVRYCLEHFQCEIYKLDNPIDGLTRFIKCIVGRAINPRVCL